MVSPYEHYSSRFTTRFGRGFLFPLLRILLIAFLLYLFITRLLVTSFQVDSGSMLPALEQKDRLFVSTLIYGGRVPFVGRLRLPALQPPARGDIVVVESPAYVRPTFLWSALEPVVRFLSLQRGSVVRDHTGRLTPRYLIKRVVGTPGDTVRMSDYVTYVRAVGAPDYVPEQELPGPSYSIRTEKLPEGWTEDLPFSGSLEPLTLGPGQYFVLGDNRPDSSDSRSWGPVTGDQVLGKAFFRYWPVARGGRL
jgi:signal peptidase I